MQCACLCNKVPQCGGFKFAKDSGSCALADQVTAANMGKRSTYVQFYYIDCLDIHNQEVGCMKVGLSGSGTAGVHKKKVNEGDKGIFGLAAHQVPPMFGIIHSYYVY